MQSRKLIGSELPLVERLRKMQGMGDYQLAALMDGVGPQAADEIERLRADLAALRAKVFTNGDRNMTMERRTFTVESDGFILDNNFDFDAGLQVSGDFVDDEKRQYAEMIAGVLNAHTLTPNVEVSGG